MALIIRPVRSADAAALADLLNAIIAAGGTTALEEPFAPDVLDRVFLTGPEVVCCFVAEEGDTGELAGFQTLIRVPHLPADVGDIGTFTRIGTIQRGIGSALFAATRARAAELGLAELNAIIRADNTGGLAFYSKQGFVDHSVKPAVPLANGTRVDRINKRYVLGVSLEGSVG